MTGRTDLATWVTGPRVLAACAVLLLVGVNLAAPSWLIGLAPACPFRTLTGYDCPLCGSTRALSALGRGDPLSAWRFNPLAVLAAVALPLAAALRRRGAFRGIGSRRAARIAATWLAAAVVIAFWILRNAAPGFLPA